ncbi:MAG: DUF3263 domain-containing protein [Cellulomonadaceae bacterium]|jgi:hypothetical protein|nr:DUF3263 domain-containing protein [Cellulomonadaceae bacterium]
MAQVTALRLSEHAAATTPATPSLNPTPGLSERDRQILAFERQWWRYAGAKEQSVRELFGLTSTRYYQILGSLIDTNEALAEDPMLVKRLRRQRDARFKSRTTRPAYGIGS